MSDKGGITNRDAAKAAIQKRAGSKTPTKAGGAKGGDVFYTEESTGLRVGPKTVLITSLVYIGIVVLLHLWGKLRGGDAPAAEGTA